MLIMTIDDKLIRRGFYPYECIDDRQKFNKTLEKEDFWVVKIPNK